MLRAQFETRSIIISKYLLVSLFMVIYMEHVQPETLGFSSARLARIRTFMQKLVNERQFAGILTMIARKGQVIHCESAGYRDIDTRQPVTEDTIFRIYSMSKMITSVAVMMLYEEGCFRLHDPLHAYLPEFKDTQVAEKGPDGQWSLVPPVRPVNIRDLLTHTSGMTYGEDQSNLGDRSGGRRSVHSWDGRGENALRDFVRGIASIPLHHQPGQMFHYGVSMDVLGRLVEVVAGMPFGDFLRQRIFEPLDMVDTDFYVPPEKLDRFACMYGPEEENGEAGAG